MKIENCELKISKVMSIFSLENLYKAYLDCRENKRKTANAVKFEYDLEENLMKLQKELANGTYQPGRSICFAVFEPTSREIFAADFRDRVVHHLLVREINEIGERNFIFDSYACRKNKGTHKAVEKLRTFIRKVSKNGKQECFYAQLDISGFFMSIDKNILYKIFEKMIVKQKKNQKWKKEVLQLGKIIIFHDPTENYITKGDQRLLESIPQRKSLFYAGQRKGLPIGNYSSQFFGNLYLNELDQFVKRKLRAKYYLRYVDDFILLNKSKELLEKQKLEIETFLKQKLNLDFSENKCKIRSVKSGIDFLGYFIKPNYVLVRKRVVKSFKNKVREIGKLVFENGKGLKNKKQLERDVCVINSYGGHFKYANSYNLKRKILTELLEKRAEFCLVGDFRVIGLKKSIKI